MTRRTEKRVSGEIGNCPNGLTYSKGCRCDICRARQAFYNRRYRLNSAKRRWGVDVPTTRVDPGPACKAVWDASSVRGLTLNEIARVTGVVSQTVQDIYHQRRSWITREVEEKILSKYGPDAQYTERAMAPNQLVDLQEHTWKLHGLFAQGWTITLLKERLKEEGLSHGWLSCHTTQSLQFRYESLQALDWLVEVIGDRHGPSKVNKQRMTRRGHFPLIHYTDEGKLIRASLTQEQRAAGRVR